MNAGQTMNCPGCGNTVAVTDQFCSKCFARLEPSGFWRKLFFSLFQGVNTPQGRILKIKKTATIRTMDKDGQRHEYHSLDEAPPELRAEIEKLESEVLKNEASPSAETVEKAKGAPRIISKKSYLVYSIKDATGQERIYRSLDEVPWEKRSQIEELGSEAMKEAALLSSETLEQT